MTRVGPFQRIDYDFAIDASYRGWFCAAGLAKYWAITEGTQRARVWFTVRSAARYAQPTQTEYIAETLQRHNVYLRGNESFVVSCVRILYDAIEAVGGRAYLGLELEE